MSDKSYVQKNLKIPIAMERAMRKLKQNGKYVSDSEIIRAAIRLLLEKEGIELSDGD